VTTFSTEPLAASADRAPKGPSNLDGTPNGQHATPPNGAPVAPLDALNPSNLALVEQMYEQYKKDPASVDPQWHYLFAGFDLAGVKPGTAPAPTGETAEYQKGPGRFIQIADLVHSYRELGHLVAKLDPLGHNMTHHPLLELNEFNIEKEDMDRLLTVPNFRGGIRTTVRELVRQLRDTYCGTFAVEFMDIRDPEQRTWLIERMEPTLNKPSLTREQRQALMQRIIAAEEFEAFLQRRFPTVKRFSNEGGDSLISLLDAVIETGAELGLDEVLIGMAHRGRLNVLTHILRKPYEMLMSEVIGRPAVKHAGDGDVKYHLGYAHDYTAKNGQRVHLSLAHNPSHLELVNPLVVGQCRAKQNRKGDTNRERTMAVLMHGDAAFTGQGIVAETLYMSELEAYRTGGSIHIIINNQIGFTTNPSDGRFTRYPSDVAKAIQAPVFHVNADDPEAVFHAGTLAMQFRQHFKQDVIVDLVCYRRRGHNELDDASVTQPVMAREIAAHPTVKAIYSKRLLDASEVTQEQLDQWTNEVRERLEKALEYAQTFKPADAPPPIHGPWANFIKVPKTISDWSYPTNMEKDTLKGIASALTRVPENFNIHKTVAKMMENRLTAVNEEKGIDWGGGEMLALGSLLHEGVWIRLTGQDVSRGTFSHRNAVWFDNKTGRPYVPLAEYAKGRSRFMIINTPLSELGVVGFEYGFASADPNALVIWEAQFGDFVNMAQPVIDQFLSSSESKWGKYCGLVMLLPHGYEGQGPEHSHARLERFLQLCAEDNMQVCYPTTPAQLFHMLRRQHHRPYRRPLIVMSPKSMLRNPLCVSTLDEFSNGQFQDIIDEVEPLDKSKVRRVVMCSGKVYYDILKERTRLGIKDVALLRLEQIYPFNSERLLEISKTYPRDIELVWVQEEPRNNGVYPFMGAKFHYHWAGMKKLYYVGRKPSASPAAGSPEQHDREQKDIIARALGAPFTSKEVKPGGEGSGIEVSMTKEPSNK